MGKRGPKPDPQRAWLHGTWRRDRFGPPPNEVRVAAEPEEQERLWRTYLAISDRTDAPTQLQPASGADDDPAVMKRRIELAEQLRRIKGGE